MFKNRSKYISTTLKNKARDVINSSRFRWSQVFNRFKISESETGAKDKSSEDGEKMWKTTGQRLLYTDRKCFENLSAISKDLIKCLQSTSSWIEIEFLSQK
jgi:hypothetical protein